MNKLFLSILYLISVIALLTEVSCSVNSDASSVRTDDVEIIEGPDGVKTIKPKKRTTPRRPATGHGTYVTGNSGSVEYDDVYSQGKVGKGDRVTVTETREVKKEWKDLNVSRCVEVDYTPSNSYGPVTVTCEKWMCGYVEVKVNGTELEITTKNVNFSNTPNNSAKIRVKVSGPAPQNISVSTAASVCINGPLTVNGKFTANVRSASSLTMQKLMAFGDVNLNLSSASSLRTFDVNGNNITLTATGASSLSVKGGLNGQSAAIDASGASSISINQGCKSVSLSVNSGGASSTSINSFNGTWMEMEIGGASSAKASEVKCNKLVMVVNGASGATVYNFKGTTLDLSVNGTSTAKVSDIIASNVITKVYYGCRATLAGTTTKAYLSASNGDISADNLHADKAYIDLTGDNGKIKVKADKIFTDE